MGVRFGRDLRHLGSRRLKQEPGIFMDFNLHISLHFNSGIINGSSLRGFG
jgi:hypothetical protein